MLAIPVFSLVKCYHSIWEIITGKLCIFFPSAHSVLMSLKMRQNVPYSFQSLLLFSGLSYSSKI